MGPLSWDSPALEARNGSLPMMDKNVVTIIAVVLIVVLLLAVFVSFI